jgi:hypothetical protein
VIYLTASLIFDMTTTKLLIYEMNFTIFTWMLITSFQSYFTLVSDKLAFFILFHSFLNSFRWQRQDSNRRPWNNELTALPLCYRSTTSVLPGNSKGGSITVPLTSCWTGLEIAVWQLTIFVGQNRLIQTSQTGGQWYNGKMILPLLVFPGFTLTAMRDRLPDYPTE